MYVYGIYRENILVYVGQTRNKVSDRFSKHLSDARLNRNLCMNIVKAIKKYGICFYSVIECEKFYKAGKGTIGRVALGRRKTYNGKLFKFI